MESLGHIETLRAADAAKDEALAREEQLNSPPLQGTVFSGFLLRLLKSGSAGAPAPGGGAAAAPSFCFEQHASLWVLYPSAICCFRSVAQAARAGLAGAVGRFTFGPQSKVRAARGLKRRCRHHFRPPHPRFCLHRPSLSFSRLPGARGGCTARQGCVPRATRPGRKRARGDHSGRSGQ